MSFFNTVLAGLAVAVSSTLLGATVVPAHETSALSKPPVSFGASHGGVIVLA